MACLREGDFVGLWGILRDVYKRRNLEAFRQEVIRALPRLIRSEITSYNEVDVYRDINIWSAHPEEVGSPETRQRFNEHIHEHPLIRHYAETGDSRALKISDFLSRRQFHALGLYNEFYRPLGVQHQLAVTLPSPKPLVIGIALNRSNPDFTERDRLCLNLLRPHLIQAYWNAEAFSRLERELDLLERGIEASGQAVVLLDAHGRVRLITSQARHVLTKMFGDGSLRNRHLPPDIGDCVRKQQGFLGGASVPAPRKPFIIERGGKRLWVRLIPDSDQTLLLLEEPNRNPQPDAFEALGLSHREAEVLAWVCQGKTNLDIATILGLSVRTVEKHVERILQKLGVESRTAAVAAAQQLSARTVSKG